MDFAWSDEQLRFREAVIRFAQRDLNEELLERDKAGVLPRDLWRRCAEFGIHGLPIPEQYGGGGAEVLTTMLAPGAPGYGGPGNGVLFAIPAHMWGGEIPILEFGTEEQKPRSVPHLCEGSWVGAHAMTEPGSGSDAFRLSTRAVRQGDRYLLNGIKTFITNAPEADLTLVFATVDPKMGMWGITAFLTERGTRGVSVGKNIEKMGLNSAPMAELTFQDCQVPVENVLGGEGLGHAIFNHSMRWERGCILASTIGAMERQLENCLRYAKERHQFGRPIGSFQLTASRIVDMKVRLETSRLLLYRAAR